MLNEKLGLSLTSSIHVHATQCCHLYFKGYYSYKCRVITVYIFSILDIDESKDVTEIRNSSLTLTRRTSYSLIGSDISYAMVEHPFNPFTLILASRGLFEVRPDGSCHLLAGASSGQCSTEPNKRSFKHASHIAALDMPILPTLLLPYSIENNSILLLVDNVDGCVRTFDLKNVSAYFEELVGTCGQQAVLESQHKTMIGDVVLNNPLWISVIYSTHLVRIIITDKTSDGKFPVILTLKSNEAYAYSFYQERGNTFLSYMDPVHGSIGSRYKTQTEECGISLIVDDAQIDFWFTCNLVASYSTIKYVPVFFMGALLTPATGHIVAAVLDATEVLNIAGMDYEQYPIDMIAHARTSGGLLLKNSVTKEVFLVQSNTFEWWHEEKGFHKFIKAGESYVCLGDAFQTVIIDSIDDCAYLCATSNKCRAFTITASAKTCFFCSLHVTPTIGKQNYNSTCYFHVS